MRNRFLSVLAALSLLFGGMLLGGSTNASVSSPAHYTVGSGETYRSIALNLGLDQNALTCANVACPSGTATSAQETSNPGVGRIIHLSPVIVVPTTTTGVPTSTTTPATTTTVPVTTVPATTTTLPTTTTTVPVTTTIVPVTTTTMPSVSTTTSPPPLAACGLPSAAFCDTFDSPTVNPAGVRSGDLNGLFWGVSRVAVGGTGQLGDWNSTTMTACDTTSTVTNPGDVHICNGRLYDAVNDNEGQTILAMYPKQPFDIAGRTGTVVFDVSADSQGPHAAWPEFWYTNLPTPAPKGPLTTLSPYAENSFGFLMADDTCGANSTTVSEMHITRASQIEAVNFTKQGCVTKGSPNGGLNHIVIHISATHVDILGTDAGGTTLKPLATADIVMPMTRGVIWIEDVHYNACKFDSQCIHTFAWDNVGFDGPAPYRDLTFDVKDASPTSPGYDVGSGGTTVSAPGVFWNQTPSKQFIAFDWFALDASVPSVSVNGGAFHTTAWPFDSETFTERTIAVPVALSELHAGSNTITLKYAGGTTSVQNINVILLAATPVP